MSTNHPGVIFTVGHSNLAIDVFVSLLRSHGVALLADIRSYPSSRHCPQFNHDALAASLARAGIDYRHLPSLGGRRRADPHSSNTGWRHPAFRGYADYMQTPVFAEGMTSLIALAAPRPTAIMCAEAVPWKCHRSLVSDALLARGVSVEDIMPDGGLRPAQLHDFAKVEGVAITYPGDRTQLQLL